MLQIEIEGPSQPTMNALFQVGLTRAWGVPKMRPKLVLYMVNMLHM
jgi:hypothetical protein